MTRSFSLHLTPPLSLSLSVSLSLSHTHTHTHTHTLSLSLSVCLSVCLSLCLSLSLSLSLTHTHTHYYTLDYGPPKPAKQNKQSGPAAPAQTEASPLIGCPRRDSPAISTATDRAAYRCQLPGVTKQRENRPVPWQHCLLSVTGTILPRGPQDCDCRTTRRCLEKPMPSRLELTTSLELIDARLVWPPRCFNHFDNGCHGDEWKECI